MLCLNYTILEYDEFSQRVISYFLAWAKPQAN